ncbi:hypothetical protein BGX27_002103, partial [Mortierella sp. AM989]
MGLCFIAFDECHKICDPPQPPPSDHTPVIKGEVNIDINPPANPEDKNDATQDDATQDNATQDDGVDVVDDATKD